MKAHLFTDAFFVCITLPPPTSQPVFLLFMSSPFYRHLLCVCMPPSHLPEPVFLLFMSSAFYRYLVCMYKRPPPPPPPPPPPNPFVYKLTLFPLTLNNLPLFQIYSLILQGRISDAQELLSQHPDRRPGMYDVSHLLESPFYI